MTFDLTLTESQIERILRYISFESELFKECNCLGKTSRDGLVCDDEYVLELQELENSIKYQTGTKLDADYKLVYLW